MLECNNVLGALKFSPPYVIYGASAPKERQYRLLQRKCPKKPATVFSKSARTKELARLFSKSARTKLFAWLTVVSLGSCKASLRIPQIESNVALRLGCSRWVDGAATKVVRSNNIYDSISQYYERLMSFSVNLALKNVSGVFWRIIFVLREIL